MEHGNAGVLGGGCDEEIWMADRAVLEPALVGELLVDLQRPPPLLSADRAGRQRLKFAS
ncbi:MAG: hypothetical protein M3065_14630 [Actinomycetota bacterium]|nr:hypothetical protein [Actinomycetota bacterium]